MKTKSMCGIDVNISTLKQCGKELKEKYNENIFTNKKGIIKVIEKVEILPFGKSCKIWLIGGNNKTIECDKKVNLLNELESMALKSSLGIDVLK